ncbi:MAG: iron complex transport system substrate-binding protein [Planctomycetota bacterium]|jgi:iron complex transport system substrate-binding protein
MIATNPSRLPALAQFLLLAALSLTSCSGGEEQTQASAPLSSVGKPSLPQITPAKGFPAKVKNSDGRVALLEKQPQRVIAGNASLLDGLITLIGPERVAALPSTAFSYSTLAANPGVWADVPLLKHFDAEELLAPRPDLIIAHNYQAGSTIDRLVERDVPVVLFPIPATWKDTIAHIECLARLLGEEERATEMLADLETRRRALQNKSARSGLRVLPYGNYGAGGTTAGAGTTWQVMIELAGMRNAAAEAGIDRHPDIDFEQLLSIDPDFFLISKSEGQSGSGAEEILRNEPLLAGLRAIRENRILILPEYLYSCASQELLTAAEHLAEQADANLAE